MNSETTRLGFLHLALLLLSSLMLVACTHVPFEIDRQVERALPTADTSISRGLATFIDADDENTVLIAPLHDGNDGLAARFRLIELAERSIDIKTFLIKPDTAGTLLWLELYDAAERGVKIRLLYDDVFTSANDASIATLNAHPNVDIRTFNPLSRNSSFAGNFILDFGRVNRRMHNKAMIVDGVVSIVGGRNVADEYYQIETSNEFADFDLLVAGEPVEDLSGAFDLFWNDQWAVPLENFTDGDERLLAEAHSQFVARKASDEVEIYRKAMASNYISDLKAGRLRRFLGTASIVVDDPTKLRASPSEGPFHVGNKLYNTLLSARNEVLIFTPYFVPEDYGAAALEELAARGVRVRIVTNSLASTNHAYVHGGYTPYRRRLLASGVEFLEVRADAPKIIDGSNSSLVLHTKLAIIDRKTLFVGSTNIDPRSIRQNTEVGLVVKSPDLADNIQSRFEAVASDYVFRVLRKPRGELEWVYEGSSGAETFDAEPGASALNKFVAKMAEWLPIESQL